MPERAGRFPRRGGRRRAGVGAGGGICRRHRAWAGSGGAERCAAGAAGQTVAKAAFPRLEGEDEERRERRGKTLLRGAGFRVRGRLRSLRAALSKRGAGRGGRPGGLAGGRDPVLASRDPFRSLRAGTAPEKRLLWTQARCWDRDRDRPRCPSDVPEPCRDSAPAARRGGKHPAARSRGPVALVRPRRPQVYTCERHGGKFAVFEEQHEHPMQLELALCRFLLTFIFCQMPC